MQFTYAIDPRWGQWLALVSFILSALAMASWWQDFFTAKQVAAGVGVMNLTVSAINYVLHGMPPVSNAVKAVLAFFAFLLASLFLFAMPARAADLVVKAPPTPTFASGSGWYVGIGSTAAVAQSNVSGTNVFASSLATGSLTAAGGSIDVAIGYITGKYKVEFDGSWQNIQGSTSVAATPTTSAASAWVASRWSASQEVGINFNLLQTIAAVIPSLSGIAFPSFTPVIPNNLAVLNAASPVQYVSVGLREFGTQGAFGAANGQSWAVAPMLKTDFVWQTLGKDGKSNGGAFQTFAWVAFPVKGFTFNNAFAGNGSPLSVGAGANLGTQYGLGMKLLFPVRYN